MNPKEVLNHIQSKKDKEYISIQSLSKSLRKSKNMNKTNYQ